MRGLRIPLPTTHDQRYREEYRARDQQHNHQLPVQSLFHHVLFLSLEPFVPVPQIGEGYTNRLSGVLIKTSVARAETHTVNRTRTT
jgi:hypothetical protein